MHTEKQARELWCPMVRATNGKQATNCAVNVPQLMQDYPKQRLDDHTTDGSCVASRCAMWRWDSAPRRRVEVCVDVNATTEPTRPFHVPASWIFEPCESDPAGWVEPQAEADARRTGYCGLAGMQAVTQ